MVKWFCTRLLALSLTLGVRRGDRDGAEPSNGVEPNFDIFVLKLINQDCNRLEALARITCTPRSSSEAVPAQ